MLFVVDLLELSNRLADVVNACQLCLLDLLHLLVCHLADGQYDAESQAEHQEGAGTVAQQRKGLSCHRYYVGVYKNVQERLACYQEGQSSYRCLGEFIAAQADNGGAPGYQAQVEQHNDYSSYQSEFLDYEAEHIVGIYERNIILLGTVSYHFSCQFPFVYRNLGSIWLPYLSECIIEFHGSLLVLL